MIIKPTSTNPLKRTLSSSRDPMLSTFSTNTEICATRLRGFLLIPIKFGYFCAFCFALIVADIEDITGSICVALPQHCPSCNSIVVYIVGRWLLFSQVKAYFNILAASQAFVDGDIFWNYKLQNIPFVIRVE